MRRIFFQRKNLNFIRIFKLKEKFTDLADLMFMEKQYFIQKLRFFV